MIERLAQGGREKLKDDGLNLSDWLQSLASFWGHLYVAFSPSYYSGFAFYVQMLLWQTARALFFNASLPIHRWNAELLKMNNNNGWQNYFRCCQLFHLPYKWPRLQILYFIYFFFSFLSFTLTLFVSQWDWVVVCALFSVYIQKILVFQVVNTLQNIV